MFIDTTTIINIAAREVGTEEDFLSNNSVKYNTEYYGKEVSGDDYPWNCVFLWWIFREADASDLFYGGRKCSDMQKLYEYHRSRGQVISSGYKPGDILLFNFGGDTGVVEHIGLLVSVEDTGVLNTIEGDTDINKDYNGRKVLRRTREVSNVIGCIRPLYQDSDSLISTDSIDTGDVISVYSTESGNTVYPETIVGISSQPMMAFIDLYIGEQRLTFMPPRYIVSFEFHRVSEGNSDFILNIFDDYWEEIEHLCSINSENIRFRYGYVNGKQSKIYTARLTDYSMDFKSTGTMLTLKGLTTGALTNLNNIDLDTEVKNPTEAAKKIAKKAGWKVLDKNFHPSQDVEFNDRDSIALINERPATYIINKLAPLAIRTYDGKGGYRFYLDESEDPPIAHFRPIDIDPNTLRTYVYMKGVDSPVIDMQLTVNGVFGGSVDGQLVTTGFNTTFIDPDTKEIVTLSEDIDSTRIDVTGRYSHTKSNQYYSTLDAAGNSRQQMNAMLRYKVSSALNMPYEGYMVLVGDPEIDLTLGDSSRTIRVLIVTDEGNLHHSSGLYMINDITDNIQSGVMTTTLHIIRHEDIQDGIELVNYRTLNN